eukprot:7356919-Prymnesium_polylepis.1
MACSPRRGSAGGRSRAPSTPTSAPEQPQLRGLAAAPPPRIAGAALAGDAAGARAVTAAPSPA